MHHCNHCDRSFKRSAHLARHKRIHTGGREHQCPTCLKTFDRRDTLVRHLPIHTFVEEVPDKRERLFSSKGIRLRACKECAKARSKCSKGRPCLRCRQRSYHCVYTDTEADADGTEKRGHELYTTPLVNSDTVGISIARSEQHDQNAQSPTLNTSIWPIQDDTHTKLLRETDQGLNHQQPAISNWEPEHTAEIVGQPVICAANDSHAVPKEHTSTIHGESPIFQTASIVTPAQETIAHDEINFSGSTGTPYNWISVDTNLAIDYDTIVGLGFGSLEDFDTNTVAVSAESPWQDSIHSAGVQVETSMNQSTTDDSSPVIGSSYQWKAISHPSQVRSIFEANLQDRYGALYADCSDGARLAASARFGHKRQRASNATRSKETEVAYHLGSRHSFPSLSSNLESQEVGGGLDLVNSTVHWELREAARDKVHGTFPSLGIVNYFAFLYFQHFHESLPILHKASIDLNADSLLTLAVISLGCRYSKELFLAAYTAPLQLLLRETLSARLSSNCDSEHSLITSQVIVLQHVGCLYNQDLGASTSVLDPIWQRSIFLSQVRLQRLAAKPESWSRWIIHESWCRLRHALFLLDGMRHYHLASEPLFDLKVANDHLPEDLVWNADSATVWAQMMRTYEAGPSLSSVVQDLVNTKTMKATVGHFARVLVLHGLYSELRNVAQSVVATRASDGPALWLPSVPTFERWRNNACDCIDALHWQANGEIARSKGLEPPIVLQLHFARTLLLVPHEIIRLLTMASGMSREGTNEGLKMSRAFSAEQEVIRWAQRDAHKARLAVLHAATCWWHIQRFSTQAFYEPAIIFLTTLTMWAYASYTSMPLESPVENEAGISFIHLDRPCDDEIVQAWIRSGRPNCIRAFIAGVGDIYAPEGPDKILHKGCDILAELKPIWRYAGVYISHLTNLLRTISQNRSRVSE